MTERLSPESGLKARRKLISGAAGESGQMQNLLGEFKGLYEGRLKRLEDAEKKGEDTTKVKFCFSSSQKIILNIYICNIGFIIISKVLLNLGRSTAAIILLFQLTLYQTTYFRRFQIEILQTTNSNWMKMARSSPNE